MNEVVMLKLISGEEIICTVVKDHTTHLDLKDVVTIAYHPTGDGQMSAGFAPHMPYSEGDVTVYITAIAFRSGVKQEMIAEYKRIFGHIITPSSKIVM